MPNLWIPHASRPACGLPRLRRQPPQVFGFYWEMLHDRSGDVVGDGFSRCTFPQLLMRPGYSYRITPLRSDLRQEAVWPS
ncbi:hypothetical protein [Roseateles sp. P5_E11]